MTTDELRAAIKRLDGITTPDAGRYSVNGESKISVADHHAAMVLAMAYMGDHPPDDAEPVSEAWLRSVGFESDPGDEAFVRVRLHGGEFPTFLSVCVQETDDAIRAVLAGRVDGISRVVFAWGNSFGKLPWFKSRIAAVRRLVANAGLSPFCLGTTEGGEPRHPVRLPSATKCIPWSGYQ